MTIQQLDTEPKTECPSTSGIHELLVRLRKESGLTQAELAWRAQILQAQISRFERHRMPDLEAIWRLEVHGFGLPAGSIARRLGLVADVATTRETMEADTRLDSKSRSMLIASYEAATS